MNYQENIMWHISFLKEFSYLSITVIEAITFQFLIQNILYVLYMYVTKIWINRCFYIIVEDYFSYLLYLSIIIIDNMNKNTYK